ncbi:cytochrome P450, putative [Talaromyces stipitatus ATCC 10500]|uniref:Cytochrome P450, putative n=1 Tax=Talaromyces stipitatus (strain ATCC 10500 / CBS 375.48 / QM 6759 / NRRL 1006) TaxID=441959 RepID=B8M881_TALSN|nr:cytochrome P450, putative [Talaromyces stipitatus ATCC 10500]EED20394.1 cytochrome P450, putative [Talaromyces stipitatus ATCC 10500]
MIRLSFILLLLAVAVILIQKRKKQDSQEPPFISSTVPYVGHALGLLRYGASYFIFLRSVSWYIRTNLNSNSHRSQVRYPIYTINLLSQKSYIINDPELISLVQRERKLISHNGPFVETVFKRMLGNNDESMGIIMSNMDGHGQAPSYRRDMKAAEHEALAPGRAVSQIYEDSLDEIVKIFRDLTLAGSQSVDLMEWLKKVYTLSTATALYGPQNPFTVSRDLVEAFWDYDSGLKMLVLDILPAVTVPAALKGRERLVRELEKFLKMNLAEGARYAEIVRKRLGVNNQHALSDDGKARSELGLLSGLLINTVPVTFWMLAYILCSQSLYSTIMSELTAAIEKRKDADGQIAYVDVTTIKQRCPILVATYREVLRVSGSATATLLVKEDTFLDERYLLKKNAIIQIPANSIHADPEVWGPDAADFKPERFDESCKPTRKQHPSAFRTFGGGASWCPGRHLAMDEVITFTACMLYTFTITPVGSSTGFKLPRKNVRNLGSIMNPIGAFNVVLNCREGLEGVRWTFGVRD